MLFLTCCDLNLLVKDKEREHKYILRKKNADCNDKCSKTNELMHLSEMPTLGQGESKFAFESTWIPGRTSRREAGFPFGLLEI